MACRKPPHREQYCGQKKSGKRHRSRRRKSGKVKRRKTCRPGKITRNPFFNYLRWFRKKHCGWSAVKIAVEGAKCWCKLSDMQRKKFYSEACRAPKMRRRSKSRRRGRTKSRRRGRTKSRRRGRTKSRRRRRTRSRRQSRCGGSKRRRSRTRSRSRRRSRSKRRSKARSSKHHSRCG